MRAIKQADLLPLAVDIVESKSFSLLYVTVLGTNMRNASVVIEHFEIKEILRERFFTCRQLWLPAHPNCHHTPGQVYLKQNLQENLTGISSRVDQ